MLAESDALGGRLRQPGAAAARRPAGPAGADAEHPFGYGRERYFWAFVVAIILFSLGGMFAIYEGVEKMRHPHELESVAVAIGMLLVAIVLESVLVPHRDPRGEAGEGPDSRLVDVHPPVQEPGAAGRAARGPRRPGRPRPRPRSPSASPDVTDDPVWDGIGTLAIGVLLVVIAVILAIEMKSLLIGESASPTEEPKIAAAIEASRASSG